MFIFKDKRSSAAQFSETIYRLLSLPESTLYGYTGCKNYSSYLALLWFLFPEYNRKAKCYTSAMAYSNSSDKELAINSNSDTIQVDTNSCHNAQAENNYEECVLSNSYMKDISSFQAKCIIEDELLITLLKLRLGLLSFDLASRFCTTNSVIIILIKTWIYIIYSRIITINTWQNPVKAMNTLNAKWQETFGNVIAIVGLTEISMSVDIQESSTSYCKSKTYTTYRSLIAVNTQGSILFASQWFTKSIPPEQIFQLSGFNKLLENKLQCSKSLTRSVIITFFNFTLTPRLQGAGLQLMVATTDEFSPPSNPNPNSDLTEKGEIQNIQSLPFTIFEKSISTVRNNYQLFNNPAANDLSLEYASKAWISCCILSQFSDFILFLIQLDKK